MWPFGPRAPMQVDVIPDDTEHLLKRIEDLSRSARANWFALMAYLAFVGITLLGVEDMDFFVDTRQTKLPLVDVSIPTFSFFWAAPPLGVALYAYLHFHLMTLWHVLAEAPEQINGKLLGERVFPWLVNDLAVSTRRDRPIWRQPLWLPANIVTKTFIWWAGPLVLVGFWWRSMPAHDLTMTMILCLCLLFSLLVGGASAVTFCNTLRPCDEKRTGVWHRGAGYILTTVLAITAILLFTYSAARLQYGEKTSINRFVDWAETIIGPLFVEDIAEDHTVRSTAEEIQARWVDGKIMPLVRAMGLSLVSANLAEAELVAKPADWRPLDMARRRFRAVWCQRQGLPARVCGDDNLEYTNDHTPLKEQRIDWCSQEKNINADTSQNIEMGGETVHPGYRLACSEYFEQVDKQFEDEWNHEWSARLDTLPALTLNGRELSNADLTDAFLPNVDLEWANIRFAIFRSAHLEGANLANTHANKAIFTGAHLDGASFAGADLRGANFINALLSGVKFEKARLEGAIFHSTLLRQVDFHHGALEGAKFLEAFLEEADFRDANLKGADLRRAFLAGADLRKAHLESARLQGADLRGANLAEAHLLGARFEGADLTGANFFGAELLEASFEGAILENVTFHGAQLENASLENANLNGSIFRYATLKNALLRGAHLTNANFRGALLKRANLHGAYLKKAVLYGASLSNADLRRASLEGADLTEANLEDALLSRTNLAHANLRSSNLRNANLHGANLEKTDLHWAHLEGASLFGTQIREAELHYAHLDRVDFSFSLFYGTDFRNVSGLTQSQFHATIGNDASRLPYDTETGAPLHLWSCWPEDTDNLDHTLLDLADNDTATQAQFRAQYVCPPGTTPECRGTLVLEDGTVGPQGSACPHRVPWPGVTTPALETPD